jgi:hypothetical protein
VHRLVDLGPGLVGYLTCVPDGDHGAVAGAGPPDGW